MIVKLDEIAISNEFREKIPNSWKMDKCREYYKRTGKQDRNIVVNHKGVLIDGYVMYLVLKEANVEYAIIKVSDHKENKKRSLLRTETDIQSDNPLFRPDGWHALHSSSVFSGQGDTFF